MVVASGTAPLMKLPRQCFDLFCVCITQCWPAMSGACQSSCFFLSQDKRLRVQAFKSQHALSNRRLRKLFPSSVLHASCIQASKTLPELRHYYMGFYIHSCPKVGPQAWSLHEWSYHVAWLCIFVSAHQTVLPHAVALDSLIKKSNSSC